MSIAELDNDTTTRELIVPRQNNNSIAIAGEQQRAMAEVQAAYTIARANPRDEVRAIKRILNSCQRIGVAEAAEYLFSRGGSDINGPTIRLMEVIAQNWGNLRFGFIVLQRTEGAGKLAGESLVRAYAVDLETNVGEEKVFTVKHQRDRSEKKGGNIILNDERDIYELTANMAQRRVRTCLEHVIPRDIVDLAREESNKTLHLKAEVTEERLKSLVDKFAALGVSKLQIEARIQRDLESMQPAQMVSLGKAYNSLRDGMGKVEDFFTVTVNEAPKPAIDTAKDAMRAKTGKQPPKPAATTAVESQDSDDDDANQDNGDDDGNQAAPAIDWATLNAELAAATTRAHITKVRERYKPQAATEDDAANVDYSCDTAIKTLEEKRTGKQTQQQLGE